MEKTPLEQIVKNYESSDKPLDLENRLKYAMAKAMYHGNEVNTPDMRKILTAVVKPENQTAGQIKGKLLVLFIYAELTGSEITCALAKDIFEKQLKIPLEID